MECADCKSEEAISGEELCATCKAYQILEEEDDITFDSTDKKNKDLPLFKFFVFTIGVGLVYYFKNTQ